LGLVLYEVFTGRKAFDAANLDDWKRKHTEEPPTAPSAVMPGLDPAVERVILRCLEKDPKARPRSVAAVAAALPGGDPLAAAIAAGETPSPEMVAAAGSDEGMKPAAAWACLILILAGLALAAWLSPRAYRHGHVPLEKPPEALAERAKEIIRRLGYTEKPLDTAWGFSGNGAYLRWVEEHDRSKGRWKDMEDGRPAAISFWYRQSPGRLVPERFRGEDSGVIAVTESDPPPTTSGMVGVELDPLGRLIRFETVPPSGPRASSGALDWSILLAEAGLDAAAFSPAEPQWFPPSYADARMARVESKPERPDRPLRVEAAAAGGRPVFFELAGPWSRPPLAARPAEPTGVRRDSWAFFLGFFQAISAEARELARRAFEATPPIPAFPWDATLRGPRAVAAHLVNPAVAVFFALAPALLFFLLRAVLRKEWLAVTAFVLIEAAPSFLTGGLIAGTFVLVVAAAEILVFLRF